MFYIGKKRRNPKRRQAAESSTFMLQIKKRKHAQENHAPLGVRKTWRGGGGVEATMRKKKTDFYRENVPQCEGHCTSVL